MTSKIKKIKICDLITISDEINRDGYEYPFFGVNINKEFMPTMASTSGLDRTKYKIIRKNRFVFSGMQTGRDKCIRIALYEKDEPVLVSPAYTTFEVTSKEILPSYLFMIFKSKEKDRYGAFLSDSSVRANLDWNRFCDIELEVPSIDIQKRFVAIYEGLLSNLNSYEKGLDDLKITCIGFIEQLRREIGVEEIGPYIEELNERNENRYSLFKGVDVNLEFIEPKRVADDTFNGKVVHNNEFAFNKVMKANCTKFPVALRKGDTCVISGSYTVFRVTNLKKIYPDYLMMWLSRSETQRWAGFVSYGTTRDIFDFDQLKKLSIPLPSIEVQKSICAISESVDKRKELYRKLNELIKIICPVLIRGSISEAKGGESDAS